LLFIANLAWVNETQEFDSVLKPGLCKVQMRTADADGGRRTADGGRRTADGQERTKKNE